MTTDAAETDFDLAYRTHYAGVHRFVFRLVDDAALADELAQDTFLKAYRAWEGFRGEASVKTWLFRIARNPSLDYLRSPRSRTHAIGGTTGHEGAEPADSGTSLAGADPDLGVATSVRRIEMTACVRDLSTTCPRRYERHSFSTTSRVSPTLRLPISSIARSRRQRCVSTGPGANCANSSTRTATCSMTSAMCSRVFPDHPKRQHRPSRRDLR